MADDFPIIAGDGTTVTIAAKDLGTSKAQRVQPVNSDGTDVGPTHPQAVHDPGSSSAAVVSKSSSITNISMLASNAARVGALFHNKSAADLYLKFGTTASLASFTVILGAGEKWPLPTPGIYTGAIDGIWTAADGVCLVTEW